MTKCDVFASGSGSEEVPWRPLQLDELETLKLPRTREGIVFVGQGFTTD